MASIEFYHVIFHEVTALINRFMGYLEIGNRSLEKINKYYESVEIKSYWSEDSFNIIRLNIITDSFKKMRRIYPEIVIEEIGDMYSIDKYNHETRIANLKDYIDGNSYPLKQ